MSRITLNELRALGLEWPPGPLDPPADADESFDLASVSRDCDYFYTDYKGDSRYLEQKRRFEELFAKLAAAPAKKEPVAGSITLPITKRKLAALGLEWPWPYPFDLDDPLDLARAMTDLTYGDLMDYTGGRGSYLDLQRSRTKAIIERLEALGIARNGGEPMVPKVEPARAENAPVTRRTLAALGVPIPSAWSYVAEDVPIDVESELVNLEVSVAEGRPGYADDLHAARNLVRRLDELRIAWRKAPAPRGAPVTRRKLKAFGLSLPFSRHLPLALDEPIDLDGVLARIEKDADEPGGDRDEARRTKEAMADIVRRLAALAPDYEK